MADAQDPLINPCVDELSAAEQCVQAGGEENCGCFQQPFVTTFPSAIEASFQDIMASNDSNDPSFCEITEDSTCQFLQDNASCCCQQETSSYAACIYVKDIVVRYDAFQTCSSTSCSIMIENPDNNMAQEQEQYIIYGIIASIIFCIFAVLYYCFCYRRRRRRRTTKKKGVEINVKCSSTGNVTETHNERHDRHTASTADSSNTRHQQSSQRMITNTRKASKSNRPSQPDLIEDDSDADDFDWNEYNQTFHKRRAQIDCDVESRLSRDQKSLLLEADHSREAKKKKKDLREKRRQIESWNSNEKARRSSRSLNSEESEDECEERRRVKRKERRKRKEDDVEKTMRQARTVLKSVADENQTRETIKITVVPQLKAIVDLLEEEKRKLEARQKVVDEERIRLTIEVDSSKCKIEELGETTEKNTTKLQKARMIKDLIRQGSSSFVDDVDLAKRELDRDLKGINQENEQMALLLKQLKQAEREIERQLVASEETKGSLLHEYQQTENHLAIATISRAQEHKQVHQACLDLDSPATIAATDNADAHSVNQEYTGVHKRAEETQLETEAMLARLAELQAGRDNLNNQLLIVQNDIESTTSSVTDPFSHNVGLPETSLCYSGNVYDGHEKDYNLEQHGAHGEVYGMHSSNTNEEYNGYQFSETELQDQQHQDFLQQQAYNAQHMYRFKNNLPVDHRGSSYYNGG